MLQWLQAVRSTTMSGGPCAATPHPAAMPPASAHPTNLRLNLTTVPSKAVPVYFSTINQPCISRCSAEQNSVQ
jgi:hypothetical protein